MAEGVDLSEPLTRARFEELNADLFKKTLGPVRKVSLGKWLSSNKRLERAVIALMIALGEVSWTLSVCVCVFTVCK